MRQFIKFYICCLFILSIVTLASCSNVDKIEKTETVGTEYSGIINPEVDETTLAIDIAVPETEDTTLIKEDIVLEDTTFLNDIEGETSELLENEKETTSEEVVEWEILDETEEFIWEDETTTETIPVPPVIEVKNPVKMMSNISSVEEFLSEPTVEDFGNNYEKAMALYRAILNKELEIQIDFTGDSSGDEMRDFITSFEEKVLNDLFWITKTTTSGAYTYFTCNPSNIYEEILMFNDFIKIVTSLGVSNLTEKEDAVIKINDWMIDYLSYELDSYDPYNAFNNRKANCDGYARLFERFCKVVGVECDWESGYVKIGGTYGLHTWNKVKLGDSWYYIDVCWNDSSVGNRYLLSPVLWDNHTKDLKINVPLDTTSNLGDKVVLKNIHSILNIFSPPVAEDFGDNYDAALAIYNGLLLGEDSVKIEIHDNDEEKSAYQVYDDFANKFKDQVLNNSMEVMFEGISWFGDGDIIIATINTSYMTEKADNVCRNINVFRDVLNEIGIINGMSQREAIVKIINWMSNNLNYNDYESGNVVEALKTRVVDYRWYAEIFYYLCTDIGIECEVIKGVHINNQQESAAYWNRVKIGDTWYYTDVWYYFVESYDNFSDYEYFLSEKLWENHRISKGY